MFEAIKLAKKTMDNGAGGPFGAVITKDNKIIGRGYNQVISLNDPTAHAEIMAIKNASSYLNSFKLKECELYTSCEPCPMCLGAIYWARIKKVYYAVTRKDAAFIGFDDNFFYEEISLPVSKRKLKMVQLLRDSAWDGFVEWKEKEDKIKY